MTSKGPIAPEDLRVVAESLAEDLGSGDITTDSVVPSDSEGRAQLVARQDAVAAGLHLAPLYFGYFGDVDWTPSVADGETVGAGETLGRLEGRLRPMLMVERAALNLLSHLSGIATLTRRYVDAIVGTGARILDTRKTTPGLRGLDKYAVRAGGGHNHRRGLYDGILIKDNHVAIAGGVTEAVLRARRDRPKALPIEVEVQNLDELAEAVAVGADRILLDNMAIDEVRESVRIVSGRMPLEVSGNITLDNVRDYAATGVQDISVGRLTHSAPSVDLSLEMEPA